LLKIYNIRLLGEPNMQVKICAVLEIIPCGYFRPGIGHSIVLASIWLGLPKEGTYKIYN